MLLVRKFIVNNYHTKVIGHFLTKIISSLALDRFAYALTEYVGNLEQAPDSTISLEDFHTEMSVAYDILFVNWLNSREVKVVETVLHALGEIYAVLSVEKVRALTVKTVHVFLGLNKKQKLTHAVTK